jgi:nitrite reductase/ring-hydroxylating ferredoxin subunit
MSAGSKPGVARYCPRAISRIVRVNQGAQHASEVAISAIRSSLHACRFRPDGGEFTGAQQPGQRLRITAVGFLRDHSADAASTMVRSRRS